MSLGPQEATPSTSVPGALFVPFPVDSRLKSICFPGNAVINLIVFPLFCINPDLTRSHNNVESHN